MRGTLYTKEIKKAVEKWRARGKTYSEIKDRFGIPKSTLSVWFSRKYVGIFDKKKQLVHLERIRIIALASIRKRNELRQYNLQKKISQEIETYPLADTGLQKSIIASLYWAEGAKYKGVSGLKFANTDPTLIKLFVTLLRKCYKLNEGKFRVYLHLHYYHKIKSTKRFWSELLDIPLSQFTKPYMKKRSATKHYRQNFRGICFIYYFDSNIRREIMETAKQLCIYYKSNMLS